MDKRFCTPLDIAQIEQNFVTIDPALTAVEAMHQVNPSVYIAAADAAFRRAQWALTCRHL